MRYDTCKPSAKATRRLVAGTCGVESEAEEQLIRIARDQISAQYTTIPTMTGHVTPPETDITQVAFPPRVAGRSAKPEGVDMFDSMLPSGFLTQARSGRSFTGCVMRDLVASCSETSSS